MKITTFAFALLAAVPFLCAEVFPPSRVSASTEFYDTPAGKAADGKTHGRTRHAYWCTERGAKPPHTLTFHYDQPVKINQVVIYHVTYSIDHMLNSCILEAYSGGAWVQLAELAGYRNRIREFEQLIANITPDDPQYYSITEPDFTVSTFDFPDIEVEQLRLTVSDPAARVAEMQAIYLPETGKKAVGAVPPPPADSKVKAYSLARERSASTEGFYLLGPEAFSDSSGIAFADRQKPGPGRAAFAAGKQNSTLSIPLPPGRYQLLALSGDYFFPGPGCTLRFAGKSMRLSQTAPGDFAWDTALFSTADGGLEITLEGPWLLNTLLVASRDERQEFDAAVNRLMLECTAESKAKKYIYRAPATHTEPPTPDEADVRYGYIPYMPSLQQRIYRQTTPAAAQRQPALRLEAARGSSRAGTLAIYALEDLEQVELTLQGDFPGAVQLLHVRQHPQKVGRKGARLDWAVVPEVLEPRRYSDVRQGESLQFYILAEVPAAARAGHCQATLRLSAAGKPTRSIPLELEVYPFILPESSDYGCFGMYYGNPHSNLFALPEHILQATLQDMRRHNMSTVILDDDSGKQPMNEDYLRRVNAALDSAGFPQHPLPYTCGGSITAERAAELFAIVKRNQWRELLFYAVDEPFCGGKERLDRAVKIYNELKSVPGLRTYSTVSQNDVNAIANSLDVRCYTVNYDTFQPDRILAECAALPGKEFWWYSNGAREYPDVVRFKAGFFHYRTGARGQFYWAYLNPRGDMFNDFDGENSDHVTVFMQDGQIISTLQWESIREGIDDYRYLRLLEELCRKYADQTEAVAAGRQLLAEIHSKLPSGLTDYKERFGNVLDIHEKSWWELEEFDLQRRRLAEAIMRFKQP
ncbi:MAG: DUF4091 domain-containing protein [Lentisphaerae bacterium]|nr:DUF4091 domain-containing protein [Lentisphaerota bacterium]